MITKEKFSINKLGEIVLLILLVIQSAVLCFNQHFDHDEFEAVHTAWKIMHDQIIYIDFFQQKPPFFHLTLIPIIEFFSESVKAILACKLYVYILFLAILHSAYLISIHVFGKKTSFLTPILLLSCTFFTDKLTEIRPDTLYIMLIMYSIFFIYRHIRIKRSSIILSGILAGLSFAVLPKAVFYIIPISAILFFRFILKKISLSNLIIYFISMLCSILPFFIYYFSKSITLEQLWLFNYSVNCEILGVFSPLINLNYLFIQNIVFFICLVPSLYLTKGYRQKEITLLSAVLFCTVFIIAAPNKQYYIPALPFLSMIIAHAITKYKWSYQNSTIILLLITVFPILQYQNMIVERPNKMQLDRIQYVLDITTLDDYVYDGSIYFNVYRNDVDYFWFSVRPNGAAASSRKLAPREYNIYKDIELKKPKIIYTKYLDINNSEIKENYIPTEYRRMMIRRCKNEK